MTFLTEARKVADPQLPSGARFRALCHCVERFSPLGFQATLEHLASIVGVAGDRWTDEQLVDALDELMRERALRMEFDSMWDGRRRELKRAGERAISHNERAERDAMPWLSWPREKIRDRRLAIPPAPSVDAFPFRPQHRHDYDTVVAILPRPSHAHPLYLDVKIYDDWLRIPRRIYRPEPTVDALAGLSAQQMLMVHSLYTRHHDGFVRQRHLRELLVAEETWIAPYVVTLIGEYVVEIIDDIADRLLPLTARGTALRVLYGRFARENRAFIELTRQRAWSYWREYYTADYARPSRDVSGRREYPAFAVLRALDAAASER